MIMGRETERKFLVVNDSFLTLAEYSREMKQGYLSGENAEGTAFRVRITGEEAFLTIKGKAEGISRAEYEYRIPVADAESMLIELCGTRVVEKVRYYLHYEGFLWEIDVFSGRHSGLIIAEIELENENTVFAKPSFAGEEVSDKFEYSNFYLSMH